MGQFVRGDVVVLNFPFSDLKPDEAAAGLGVGNAPGRRLDPLLDHEPSTIRCYSVELDSHDFTAGGLNQSSKIRSNRLFTADEGIIVYRAGHVSGMKLNEVLDRLVAILKQP